MPNPLGAVRSFIDWLRAGYPDEAPRAGHCSLIALNGPMALSDKQTREALADLSSRPINDTDIKVAITKAIDRLPTASQVDRIRVALEGMRPGVERVSEDSYRVPGR